MQKTAIIIGAGPAGLTAALELLERTDIKPVILERSKYIGGISKTISYKGNRIDIGGHRFFSKSDRVMDWWQRMMPLEQTDGQDVRISYQNKTRTVEGISEKPENPDTVLLVRDRQSRIYYLKQFFSYPVTLSADTVRKLGPVKITRVGISYLRARLQPVKPEVSLEDFFINRFGRELYQTFFKDYTEKVWGVPCNRISSDWGAQRIKGLSISKALLHAIKKLLPTKGTTSVSQKDTETSLIERFLYPKFGPGQMWEEVAQRIKSLGGQIIHDQYVERIQRNGNNISAVVCLNPETGMETEFPADLFFSTMPVQELISGMSPAAPADVQTVAAGLEYRDFMTVGLLLKKLRVKDADTAHQLIRDNWIYIQEREVKLGRLQIFNNWSPYMVADPGTVWLGLEYFCFKGDSLWEMPDEALKTFAIDELARIGIIDAGDVLDGTVLREEKTYPAYFGTYENFDVIRDFTDTIENLYLIGRNGMHKYNNSDHSMLTAMEAVDNIVANRSDKSNIWAVNTEQDYHESKS